jgi:hypothetical protein
MTTTVVYGDLSDGQLRCTSSVYANAREGTGTLTAQPDTDGDMFVGQAFFSGPQYDNYLSYLAFDTSTIFGTISLANLTMFIEVDETTSADPTFEARQIDWGPTCTTADWVAGSALGSLPLLATWGAPYTGDFADVNMVPHINQSGFTRMLLCSDRHRLGTAPTGLEDLLVYAADIAGTANDPKLTIIHEDQGPASPLFFARLQWK